MIEKEIRIKLISNYPFNFFTNIDYISIIDKNKILMKFDLNKYLGKWYEIAKIPNEFQNSNAKCITAEYTLNDNNIKVINTIYFNNNVKQTIVGKIIKTNEDDLLKVSFKDNIYSDYRILAIDSGYNYALVGGSNKNYLWILSRTENIYKNIYDNFINIAKEKGYDINKIVIN